MVPGPGRNRPQLVAYRLRKQSQIEEQRLLARYREVVQLLERLHQQQAALPEEHRTLLDEQRAVFRLLLKEEE